MIRPAHLLLLAVPVICGCNRTTSLKLPSETPDAELAFVILYDEQDNIDTIGEVVRRQALYSGRYGVESKAGSLTPRLYFVKTEEIQAESQKICDGAKATVDRFRCLDAAKRCEEDPKTCLSVVRAANDCGARLELPTTMALEIYEPDNDDNMILREADRSGLLAGARLCGPITNPDCPNRLPGFIVTENGQFRCIAEAEQLQCELTLDLSGCGIPTLKGTLDSEGSFVETSAENQCTLSSVSAGQTLQDVPGYAIQCPERRFVASHIELLFGTPQCPRRGPGTFNSRLGDPGQISTLQVIDVPGSNDRYVMLGRGVDDCAVGGCRNRGECNECISDCDQYYYLRECRRNLFAPCTGTTQRADCLRRCDIYCEHPNGDECLDDAYGVALTTATAETPEVDTNRINLDPLMTSEEIAWGTSTLLQRGSAETMLVAALRTNLVTFTLPVALRGRHALPFDLSGLTAHPTEVDQFYAHGQSRTAPIGQLARARLSLSSGTTIDHQSPRSIPQLPSVDQAVVGGLSGQWLFLASTWAPSNQLVVAPVDSAPVPEAYPLNGPIRALAPLPRGAVLAAIGGERDDTLVVVIPSALGIDRTINFTTIPGLRISTMLNDPVTCSTETHCRVYVGFEVVEGDGDGLVGVFSFNAQAPDSSRLLVSLVETASPEVAILRLDRVKNQLISIGAAHNTLTQIALQD